MVTTLAEILFSTLGSSKQHLSLIENGIGSIVEKCKQANRNEAILEAELLKDLHLMNRLQTKKQNLNTITLTKGIASWNENTEYAAKKIEEYNIDFGILINQAPPLSQEFKINLSSKIIYLLRTANYGQKKIDTIKQELAITEENLLDLEATYELIDKQKIGKVSLEQSGIAGKIAEAYMQYAIADAVYKQGRNIRLHHSFETKGQEIRINGNAMKYNVPTEMDFILTYKKDEYFSMLKNKLQEKDNISIIENKNTSKNVISYSKR
ncbi:MAG: hypothetical protein ACQESE_04890 [Nanobdellota archaeon]